MVTDISELVPSGSSLLLTGPEGSGKTTFSLQWIVRGCNNGEHGIYVVFDESPDELRKQALQMGLDIKDLEDVSLLTIVDGFFPRIGMKSKEQFTTRSDVDYLLLKIAPMIEQYNTTRIVVDSITSLLAPTRIFSEASGDVINIKQRTALIRMSEFLKKQGITLIYTEVESRNEHPKLEKYLVDSVIELKLIKTSEEIKRRLLVEKMRFKDHPMHYIDFLINKEQGIVFK